MVFSIFCFIVAGQVYQILVFPLFTGCTPLILAATAGHASTVEILLDHGADIEAQSDRTKDTALSLACSGGRQEVSVLFIAFNVLFVYKFTFEVATYTLHCTH